MLYSVHFKHPQSFCVCRDSSVYPAMLPPGSYVFRRQGHPINPDLNDWLVLVSSHDHELQIPDGYIVGIDYQLAMSFSVFDGQFPDTYLQIEEIPEIEATTTDDQVTVAQLIADSQHQKPATTVPPMPRIKVVARTTPATSHTPPRYHTRRRHSRNLHAPTTARYHPACRRTC